MERDKVGFGVELIKVLSNLYTLCLHLLCRHKRVKCHNLHPEALGQSCNKAAYVAICLNAKSLALKLRTGARGELIPAYINHHTERKLCNCI